MKKARKYDFNFGMVIENMDMEVTNILQDIIEKPLKV